MTTGEIILKMISTWQSYGKQYSGLKSVADGAVCFCSSVR